MRTPRLACMSTRATNFLYQWLAANIPATVGAEVISVAELTHNLLADAKAIGISGDEFDEDTGSVYQAVLDAIVHHDEPGMAE